VAKDDIARGPVATWARRERTARGWKNADVVRELAKRSVHITELSYRGYEAGPRVSAPVRKALEAIYGSTAPDTTKQAAEPAQLDSLINALLLHTEALSAQTEVLNTIAARLDPMSPEQLAALRAAAAASTEQPTPEGGGDPTKGDTPVPARGQQRKPGHD
jgi:hypothetical protein